MSTAVVEVVRGTDGRLYPARRHTDLELDRIVNLTYQSRFEMRLSMRAMRTIGEAAAAMTAANRCDDGREPPPR